jgi:hypothetical protein
MVSYRLTCWLGLSFVCYSLSAPPEEIWRDANRRADMANRIAKLKYDLARKPPSWRSASPSATFAASLAFKLRWKHLLPRLARNSFSLNQLFPLSWCEIISVRRQASRRSLTGNKHKHRVRAFYGLKRFIGTSRNRWMRVKKAAPWLLELR